MEDQNGTVLLFDDEYNYVCEGEIENGILRVQFTDIFLDSGEFYLFAEEGNTEIIEFVAEDVFLEITNKEYV